VRFGLNQSIPTFTSAMNLFERKVLVVVPARGGSKRIPKKNLFPMFGQPMIYWPLYELSKLFLASQVLVSTDDDAILSLAAKKGLSANYRRPADLADDHTGTVAVASHALHWHENTFGEVEFLVTVYPTAVLLRGNDILEAFRQLEKNREADSIMSATNFPSPIQRAVFLGDNGFAQMFQPRHYYSRSQDLVPGFFDAGQFYISRAGSARAGKILTNSNTLLHPLKREEVIDIDDQEDLDIALSKIKVSNIAPPPNDWTFKSSPCPSFRKM